MSKKIIFILCIIYLIPVYAINNLEAVLNRLTFGINSQSDIVINLNNTNDSKTNEKQKKLNVKTLNEWLEIQMNPELIADSAVDLKLQQLRSLNNSFKENNHLYFNKGDLKQESENYVESSQITDKNKIQDKDKDKDKDKDNKMANSKDSLLASELVDDLIDQRLIRAVESKKQLQEVLTYFWYNHFNISYQKNRTKWFLYNYENEVIRKNVFRSFNEMLQQVFKHPAMLIYLDNGSSKKNNINENFAREVMELHTLGVDNGYTQKDIIELARILTGWEIKNIRNEAIVQFNIKKHDLKEKFFLGQVFPKIAKEDPQAEKKSLEQMEQALKLISFNKKTAFFLAKKLCVFFISDKPTEKSISEVANEFIKTEGDFKKVYRKLFSLNEFWQQAEKKSKIKTPFRYVVSSLRMLNSQLEIRSKLKNYLDKMGEMPFQAAPPTGYSFKNSDWVTTSGFIERINFAIKLTENKIKGVNSELIIKFKPKNKEDFIIKLIQQLAFVHFAESTKKQILSLIDGDELFLSDGEYNKKLEKKIVGLILSSPENQNY